MAIDNHAEVRAALDCLLQDPAFQASARNRQFLRFVVEETLAGRGGRIKSYTIAVDVFGRPANFDGSVDPIVRIEASRLRAALSNYYADPKIAARIRICLPKGGYMPEFKRVLPVGEPNPAATETRADKATNAAEPTATTQRRLVDTPQSATREVASPSIRHEGISSPNKTRPTAIIGRLINLFGRLLPNRGKVIGTPILFVDQVEAVTNDAETNLLARTLNQSLISALGQYDGITVSRKLPDGEQAVSKLLDESPSRPAYRLASEVRIDQDKVRLWWHLSDMRTMEVYRSADEEGPWRPISKTMAEAEIAAKVAAAIAQRNGLINSFVARAFTDPPQPGYPSVLRAQRYSIMLDPKSFPVIRSSLERTVIENPDYAEAWAYLAYIYCDETRNRYSTSRTHEESITLAQQAAANALRLAPFSALTYLALLVVAFQAGDDQGFENATRRALEIAPSDPKIMILAGNRFYAIGDRDRAMDLIQRGLAISGTPAPLDLSVPSLDSYIRGDYQESISLSQRMPDDFYLVPMMMAASYGQLGDIESAQAQIHRLLEMRPAYATEMRADFRRRRYIRSITDQMAEGLRKAGLPISEDHCEPKS